ncbi:MAG: aldo/keto reductase [Peptoniphilaceae bacterium]
MKYFKLNNGNKMPAVGFGCYKVTDKEILRKSLLTCKKAGYEMIDTAFYYNNEEKIGEILKEENLDNSFQIATKIWPSDFGYDNTKYAVERALKSLKRDSIDLMYLHWPGDDSQESWKVLEEYYEEGIFKNIGLCNFYKDHLEKLSITANISPQIDQIEIHPLLNKKELVEYLQKNNIQALAWSPLARADKKLFDSNIVKEISKKHNKTIAQVILKFNLQRDIIVIPKSQSPNRIAENIDIFDFELDKEDMDKLYSLNEDRHISASPLDQKWLHQARYGK